jgi:hypothetical protein
MCVRHDHGHETCFTGTLLFEIAGHIDPLIDAAAFAARHADVVFIGAAVALDAVLEVANAFFNVFTADFVRCVLMATVTGIGAVVVAHVAGHALGIVVFVQHKVGVVVKRGGRPLVPGCGTGCNCR